MRSERVHCPNRNHGRDNAPVRFCPDCSGVVNENVAMKQCSESQHAQNRKLGRHFCIDCGKMLRA